MEKNDIPRRAVLGRCLSGALGGSLIGSALEAEEHDLMNDVSAWNEHNAGQIHLLVVRTHAAARALMKHPKRNVPVFRPMKPFPFGPLVPPIR